MPAVKAYLSRPEQDDLIAWMVGHQYNYERYTTWCDRNAIPPENRFTIAYLRRWTQKRRAAFQARARKVEEDLRKQSVMDRSARLRALEESFKRLEELAAKEKDAGTLVRLEEQKQKTLDRIARERGEYNKVTDDGPDEAARANAALRDMFGAHFVNARRLEEAKDVTPG